MTAILWDFASPLMNDGPPGPGKLAVYFQDGLVGPEADGCMTGIILPEPDGKFFINLFLVTGLQRNGNVNRSALDAFQD